tara:strand:- start:654 stop:929 length:276 start_codon:yes stop_codon:yes gene_type:complete
MACNSSGVSTASALITRDRCKLVSVHASGFTGTGTIKIFNNNAASGIELVRMSYNASIQVAMEFDMHGVIADNGLYLEISGGGAAVSVEFA